MATDVISSAHTEILEECQEAIGYRFRKPHLLRSAHTHFRGRHALGLE